MTSASPFATINTPPAFCEGNSVQLLAGGGNTYSWFPAAGLSATNIPNPLASPTDTTIYFVVVSNGNNCTDTAAVTLNVLKKPTANAGPDKIVVRGQPVLLEGIAGGSDISYSWLPPTYLDNPLLLQPTARPLNEMTYTLRVVSEAGCGIATDDLRVTIFQDIYIPSAFSPNKDGLNDTWRINALAAIPNAKVTVYNRYGKVIFETTGNSKQWDGTYKGRPQPTGAYTYLVELNNGRPLMKGTVMIVR
jgi:gliding motility-associated-like protein